MNQLQYLDFELVIEKAGSQYQVRVVRSPVGEATHTFSLPFSDLELENFVLRLGASSRGRRRIRSPEMQLARQFGGKLFEAVFRGDVRASFVSGQHEAERRGSGLRLKLRLEAPELVNVPWEYLYDGSVGRFLSLFEDTPIVRYLDMRGTIVPLSVSPPLSVLVMLSTPSDCQELDVEREKANLESALSELVDAGMLTLTIVQKATLPGLADCLLRGRYHVFHYIGHGGFDERSQDGVLILEDEWGRGHLASGERLAVLLGNHTTMRLVLLNACEGARTSRDDPFAGTATTLVRTGGVPAVVAMQFPITDEAAITFTRGFYTALSVGRPVDAAVTHARLAIFADDNDVEWGTPVLYMRAPDGCIFDVAALTPEAQARLEQQEEDERTQREAQARLADLDRLFASGDTAAQAEDWSRAIEAFEQLVALDAGHADAAARLGMAREAQARQEQERRRQAVLARRYKDACKSIDVGDWPGAERLLREIQEADPNYRDVEALLARVTTERESEERLEQLYAEAEEAYSRAVWKRAESLYKQVLAQKPGYREAEARRDEALRQQQLAARYSDAWAHLEAGRWREAIESFEAVVALEPGYDHPVRGKAADLLAKARKEKERADLPAPPAHKQLKSAERPKPTGLPEEIERRGRPVTDPDEEERPSALPTSKHPKPSRDEPRPAGLPEEIKRRDKPKDLPS